MSIVKNGKRKILQWGAVSANKVFLQDLLNKIMEQVDISELARVYNKKGSKMPMYKLQFGYNDSIKLGNYIYANCNLKLERKFVMWSIGKELPAPKHTRWTSKEIEQALSGEVPVNRSRAAYYSILRLVKIKAQKSSHNLVI